MELIDYNNSIVNLANSLLKYYGLKPFHNTLKVADDYLNKNYQNVIVILLDGLGIYNLQLALAKNDFLRHNLKHVMKSVYPPTTTASTTSFMSGLTPSEHCVLGWDMYFKDIDKSITVFSNNLKDTEEKYPHNVFEKYFPFKRIYKSIEEQGIDSVSIMPNGTSNGTYYYEDFLEALKLVTSRTYNKNKTFTYLYYGQPDTNMHKYGVDTPKTINKIKELNKTIANFSKDLNDSLIFVIADHGHINVKPLNIHDYPLSKTLRFDPVLEGRTCSFYLKDKQEKNFLKYFEPFSKDFILYKKSDFIKEKFLGESSKANDYLGDYIAVCKTDKLLVNSAEKVKKMKGAHAGYTKEEMEIPLIVVEKE